MTRMGRERRDREKRGITEGEEKGKREEQHAVPCVCCVLCALRVLYVCCVCCVLYGKAHPLIPVLLSSFLSLFLSLFLSFVSTIRVQYSCPLSCPPGTHRRSTGEGRVRKHRSLFQNVAPAGRGAGRPRLVAFADECAQWGGERCRGTGGAGGG